MLLTPVLFDPAFSDSGMSFVVQPATAIVACTHKSTASGITQDIVAHFVWNDAPSSKPDNTRLQTDAQIVVNAAIYVDYIG